MLRKISALIISICGTALFGIIMDALGAKATFPAYLITFAVMLFMGWWIVLSQNDMDKKMPTGDTPLVPPPTKAGVFPDAVRATLTKSGGILDDRGESYGDSWANPVSIFSDYTERCIGDERKTIYGKRAVSAAHHIDTKISRIMRSGKFNPDTPIDMVNYIAAWTEFMLKVSK
jgi:hypothetical protein